VEKRVDSTVSRLSKRVTANPASAGGAGISSEYLQRLEQGRDRHPSAEVLDSIARALRMDAKATNHLHKLAHSASRPHRAPQTEHVSAAVAELIDQFMVPAVVVTRYQDAPTSK
jgi:transcriptional regulator with XRE-family HTH domain